MSGTPPGKKRAGGAASGDNERLRQRRQNVSLYSKKGTYSALRSFDILTKGSVARDKPFAHFHNMKVIYT
jgi:hypothetical protein